MEQTNNTKEVYFNRWCRRCKYRRLPENSEPCEECLTNPVNYDSHRPVKFERGVTKNGRS